MVQLLNPMEDKTPYRKEMCIGCKRITAQEPCIVTKQTLKVKIVICGRCQEEAIEIAKVYELIYGWRPAFAQPVDPNKN